MSNVVRLVPNTGKSSLSRSVEKIEAALCEMGYNHARLIVIDPVTFEPEIIELRASDVRRSVVR